MSIWLSSYRSWLALAYLLLNTTFFFLDPTIYASRWLTLGVTLFVMLLLAASTTCRVYPEFLVGFAFVLLLQMTKLIGSPPAGWFDAIYPTGFIALLFMILWMGLDRSEIQSALNKYLNLFAMFVVPGIVIQLALFLNLPMSYELVHLGGRQNFYRIYYSLVVVADYEVIRFGGFTFTRLAGMFEEAGMLGTYAAILLTADMICFPGKKLRKGVIAVAGLLSFSLAFYIWAAAWSLRYVIKSRPRNLIWAVGLMAGMVLFSPREMSQGFRYFVVSRLTLTDSGRLAGDTGTIDYGERFKDYLDSASAWQLAVGNGGRSNASSPEARFGDIRGLFYEGGIVGLLMAVGLCGSFLILLPIRRRDFSILPITSVCLLALYHRPDFLSAQYLSLYASCVCVYMMGAGDKSRVGATFDRTFASQEPKQNTLGVESPVILPGKRSIPLT